MPFFFNGKLYISPVTVSYVNDAALANQAPNVGNNLLLIGPATGGQPNTVIPLGSPAQAVAALRSGDLLDAATRAFLPSLDTDGPNTVNVIRVNPATQSTINLLDASSVVSAVLTSKDWGIWTNQIKVKLEGGTLSGIKVTLGYGTSTYVGDNLTRSPIQVQYAGTGTGLMTITETQVTLVLNGVSTAIDLTQYPTVQQLVDRMNSIAGITASVLGGYGGTPALNGLDHIGNQDIKTAAYTAPATLQAMIDWFNSGAQPLVSAVRGATPNGPPAGLAFTYLTGGSEGSTTNTDWQNAFTTAQNFDAQWIVPVSSTQAIHAMADTHVQFMSTVGRKERRAVVGTALATSDSAAIALAAALNSDRTSMVHLGIYDFNAAGNMTLYPPYIAAAMIGAMFAAVSPGTPLTNKTIRVRGLERLLRNPTDTDTLITGGILPLESTPFGFKVVKSISTWLTNSNFNRVEQSCGAAVDYTARYVREGLDTLRGSRSDPLLLSRALSIMKTRLDYLAVSPPVGPGTIVGDKNSPPYTSVTASIDGDIMICQFQCSPVIPNNFIGVVINAVPFKGTATLAAA